MKSEFFVEYALFDTTALYDSQVSTNSNSDFANLGLIKDNISSPNYATLEHNFFILNGSMEEFPQEPTNLVFFSSEQSGAEVTFEK